MEIVIVGRGKMGMEINKQSILMQLPVKKMIGSYEDLKKIKFDAKDVVVDFTTPDTIIRNIRHYMDVNVPCVIGTTGWYAHLEEVKDLVAKKKGSFIYGANFSLGVSAFFRLIQLLSSLSKKIGDYRNWLTEAHHVTKKDMPSGTALKIIDMLEKGLNHPLRVLKPHEAKPDEFCNEDLILEIIREGNITGIHELTLESDNDKITIRHEAKDRGSFARGALEAASWIFGKKGFFTFEDYLKEKYKENKE